ncbi:MAG: hypothetical protein IKC02_05930, partial [Oscillospiraceae bacterium]|nr:hypothetical protein [Oscillospiraceae bacterium]
MKRIFCVLLMIAVMLGCIPVFASPTSSTDLVGSLIDNDGSVPRTELDWDSLVNEFLAAAQVEDESVAIGYYNTVTGEEHYLRGYELVAGGSLYSLPLTMYYSEMLHNEEISWDTTIGGYDYRTLIHSVICSDDIDKAKILISGIGSDEDYRRDTVRVRAVVDLILEDVYIQPGDTLKAGDPIASVYPAAADRLYDKQPEGEIREFLQKLRDDGYVLHAPEAGRVTEVPAKTDGCVNAEDILYKYIPEAVLEQCEE